MQRNRQRKRNRNASDIEVDREVEAQPELSQAQKNKKASGEARRDRHDNNTWHAKKAKRHTVMRGVCAAGLEAGAVVASEVVELRVVTQLEAWVEACSMRALLGSLLLGLAVRGWFTRVRGLPDGQDVFEEIPAELAVIPNLADRNMYLQLIRGLPRRSRSSQPSAAVEDVLAFYPRLHDRLKAVPRYLYDSNTVDDVGTKLETNFANSLTELFLRRVEQAVALAGARVIAGSHEHQRRLWLPVGGSPAWTERQRSWVARSVQGKVVTWLEGAGGVVPTVAMRDEVARQRRLLGLGQGVVVDKDWLESKANRGSLLRHAVDTSRQLEAANVSWQLDWAAHHIKLDTRAIYGLMRTAGMLPADITSEEKFRSGVAGPQDSEVANRWNAFLPNLAAVRPNVGQKFAQVVHTDGVAISLMFIRPKPAEPPGELPRMGKEEGAVNPLAHLDAHWLGCDPGKTNMATVAHEERYPSGAVKSVWQRSLTAGQYYRQSGITEHAKESKVWTADIKPQHDLLSQVTNYTASLQRYREYADTTLVTWPAMWAEMSKRRWSNARFRLYGGKQRTVAKFWAETVKGAKVRCNSAATGRPLALAYGAAGFSGSGSIGSRGVPVSQMLKEACRQFPGRVLLVHEFRTSRVSSARSNVVAGQAESFRWLHPVRSMATRSRIRGLMCSTSNGIRFYDRDVSAALNIARIAAGPGRPRELSSWLGRPAMPNPGRPGQEWVQAIPTGIGFVFGDVLTQHFHNSPGEQHDIRRSMAMLGVGALVAAPLGLGLFRTMFPASATSSGPWAKYVLLDQGFLLLTCAHACSMLISKYHPYKEKGGHAARCAVCVKSMPASSTGWVDIHVEGKTTAYRSGQSLLAISQVTAQMSEVITACDNLKPALIPLAHMTCAEAAAAALAVGQRLQGQEPASQLQPMPRLCSTQAPAQPGPAHAPCPHHLPDQPPSHPSQSQLQGSSQHHPALPALLHLPGLSILTRPATNPVTSPAKEQQPIIHTTEEQDEQTMPPSMPKQQQDWATASKTQPLSATAMRQLFLCPCELGQQPGLACSLRTCPHCKSRELQLRPDADGSVMLTVRQYGKPSSAVGSRPSDVVGMLNKQMPEYIKHHRLAHHQLQVFHEHREAVKAGQDGKVVISCDCIVRFLTV
ncbi:hypothetical protein QJQ45_019591 [Haematococcus lacustris]|nr:hypothetical protein QJQ45_019591 [Haematococcus lacustris]